MFKRLVNEARVRFSLQTKGPLLIRQGDETSLDPLRPDMQFVRTVDPRSGLKTVYLPGSSLKGVFRSRVEQVVRGLLTGTDTPVCSVSDRDTCGKAKLGGENGTVRYRHHCPVCQIFGSLLLGSRISFRDAFPAEGYPPVLGQRKNVGINRISGGAQGGALFNPEVVESGRFDGEFVLTNYATWQLGLLLLVLDDLNLGFLGLGAATSRGFGRVTVPSVSVEVRDFRGRAPERLTGYRDDDVLPLPVSFARQGYCHQAALDTQSVLSAVQAMDLVAAIRKDREGAEVRG